MIDTNKGKKYQLDILKYYIEFAKADSKLACINGFRDFDILGDMINILSNVLDKEFITEENYKSIFKIYYDYMIEYYNNLQDISDNKPTKNLDLVETKSEEYEKTKNIQSLIEAINYLKEEIDVLENKEYNPKIKPSAPPKKDIETLSTKNEKIISAMDHYKKFYISYDDYNDVVDFLETNKKDDCIHENNTMVSEFHQGMTHLSRYVNNKNIRELYRFDSHFIRAIFDLKKLTIASLID